MPTDVRIPTILRGLTGGERTTRCDGATLGALLADLTRRHPGLQGRLVWGSPGSTVDVFVNDADGRDIGGLDTPVIDGDLVTIVPRLAGD